MLVILAPLSYALLVTLKEKAIQWMMREKLNSEELVTITLKAEEVIWMDRHEIRVNGYMFDIATQKLEDGRYTFTGLFDKEETDLVNKHQENHDQHSDGQAAWILSLLFTPAIPDLNTGLTANIQPASPDYPLFPESTLKDPCPDQISPPPQAFFA